MTDVIHVAVGVLTRPRDAQCEILIARRPSETVLAGYWEFPGGKIEHDEQPRACLAREFREELGIEVAVGEAIGRVEHEYDHGHVKIRAYYCTHVSGEPQDLEVAEHRWVSPDALSDFTFPPANASLLREIQQALGASRD